MFEGEILLLTSVTVGEFDEELRVTTPARHLQCVQPPHQQHLHNQEMSGVHRAAAQHHHHQQHATNEKAQNSEHDLMGMVQD